MQNQSIFLLFQEFKTNFQINLTLSQFLNPLTQHEIISKRTIVYGGLRYGIKQKSVTFAGL